MKLLKPTICLISLLFLSQLGFAQENENESTETDDLANKIQNPIASLISLPFQNNTDFNTGPDDRTLNTLNIQPVIPISLNENLNLITRTIVPIITQCNATDSFETGLGDVNLSLFLTPAKPSKLAYGYGLALGLPTATESFFGSEHWTAGPSSEGLAQPEDWTIGTLLQNTWSYAGADDLGDVNFFYSQIFVAKNLEKGWYVNSAPIITANREADSGKQWTVLFGSDFGKLFRKWKQPINAQVGYYFNLVKPEFSADAQLGFQEVLLLQKLS
ncbi:MAG: neuromedin U [Psychroserpens sp.]|nr:neuromedin U [Psychroserpens sp.]